MVRKTSTLIVNSTLLILLLIAPVKAQENIVIPDTLDNEWYSTWIAGLNGSQSTFENWAAGGQNNVSATVFSRINGAYQKGRFKYGYVINLRYGITNIEGEESRKTDDRIATKHRIAYILNDANTMNMFAQVSFVTQFYDGYDYSGEERVRISDFMAPGYFTESIGYAYTPRDFISFEAGLALKQTIVTDDSLVVSPGYGIDPGENLLSEGGLNLGISFNKEILPNVNYNSSLETFNNLKKPVVSTDFAWANELTGRINSFMTASFTFEMIYDDDVIADELQTKQILGVGILFNLR
ncbi:MAG: DUF3078 domain-containing protein [Balneolales bacterium]|nr:DUF3078 domain-containing protein [Balneolales bacterium]